MKDIKSVPDKIRKPLMELITETEKMKAAKEQASEAPVSEEFEVLEYLGPEINVPEKEDDNNDEAANIEQKASPEPTKESVTSSEIKKSDDPDIIILD